MPVLCSMLQRQQGNNFREEHEAIEKVQRKEIDVEIRNIMLRLHGVNLRFQRPKNQACAHGMHACLLKIFQYGMHAQRTKSRMYEQSSGNSSVQTYDARLF